MGKVETLVDEYRERGLEGVLRRSWYYTLVGSPVAGVLEPFVPGVHRAKLFHFDGIGYWPELRSPRSFNEKIIHRKLFTDRRLYSTVADKWSVRSFVRERVGSDVLTDVHHVTDDPDTIPFEDLPDEFVVKATHGSGWNLLIDDERAIDPEAIRSRCRAWLSESYGGWADEYWYDDIEPRILVEEFLHARDGGPPDDYKFYVFDGSVACVHVDFDRFDGHKRRLYTPDWDPLDVEYAFPLGPTVDRPACLDEMIRVAEALGADFDFVRVDLYALPGGDVRFGELTLSPEADLGRFEPVEFDFELGSNWAR